MMTFCENTSYLHFWQSSLHSPKDIWKDSNMKLIWCLYFHHKCSQRTDKLVCVWVPLIFIMSEELSHPLFLHHQLCKFFLSLGSCSQSKANIFLTAVWKMPSLICLSSKKYGIILSLAATPFPSGNFWRWKSLLQSINAELWVSCS